MKRFQRISILLLALLLWNSENSRGQVDCSIILKDAQKLYDNGVIERVPTMLTSCLKSGFSKEEKLQALKLLTLTYLFEDKLLQAEKSMMKILKIDPEYAVNTAVDPIEFINLHSTFRTEPIYTFGVKGGLNFTSVSQEEEFGVGDIVNNSGTYMTEGSGFQVSGMISRHIIEGLSAGIELSYIGRKFKYLNSSAYEFSSLQSSETQNWFSIPIIASYSFLRDKKLQPFAEAGFVPSFLLSAKSSLTRTYLDNSLPTVTGAEVDIIELRNTSSSWWSTGVGAKYKVSKGHFILTVNYLIGIKNQALTDNRYTNQELIYKYHYIDSDFFINNLLISVGYSYSLYNPKLKTKKQQ